MVEASEKAVIARVEASEKAAIAREEAGAKAAIAREEARDISVDRSFRQSDTIWASRHLDLTERVERSRIETALHNKAGHADASKERTRLYNGAFGKINNLERNIFEIQKVRDGDKELLRSSIATPLKDIVLELKNQNVDPQLQDLDGLEEDPWTTFLQDTWNTVDTFNEPSPTKSRGWSRDPSRAGSNTASPARSRGHSPVKVCEATQLPPPCDVGSAPGLTARAVPGSARRRGSPRQCRARGRPTGRGRGDLLVTVWRVRCCLWLACAVLACAVLRCVRAPVD